MVPLCLVVVVQGVVAVRRGDAVRYVYAAAAGCVALAAWLAAGPIDVGHLILPVHVFLACVLAIGALVPSRSGRLVQHFAALLVFAAVAELTVFGSGSFVASGSVPGWLVTAYPALAIATVLVYGYLLQNAAHFAVAAGVAMLWLSHGTVHTYRWPRDTMAGLDYLVWGLLAFAVALAISISKISKLRQWLRVRQRLRERAR